MQAGVAVSTKQIAIPETVHVDSIIPDTALGVGFGVGQMYASGTKGNNWRTVCRVDVGAALSGWTDLTAGRLVGNVYSKVGSAFAATLRRVTEEFTYSQASYNHRTTADHWATAGADTPNSATDTDPEKIGFTSPAANGVQTIVSGLLTLVNDAINSRGGIFLFHVRSDNEGPGVSTYYEVPTTLYLEVDGTAPPAGGRRRGVRVV